MLFHVRHAYENRAIFSRILLLCSTISIPEQKQLVYYRARTSYPPDATVVHVRPEKAGFGKSAQAKILC